MAKEDPYAGLPDHVAEAFRSGGSVIVDGVTVTDPDELPEGFDRPKAQPRMRVKVEAEKPEG